MCNLIKCMILLVFAIALFFASRCKEECDCGDKEV